MRSPAPSIIRKSFHGLAGVGRPGAVVGPKNTFPVSDPFGSTGVSTLIEPICEPSGQLGGSLLSCLPAALTPKSSNEQARRPTPPPGESVIPFGSVTSALRSAACQIGES